MANKRNLGTLRLAKQVDGDTNTITLVDTPDMSSMREVNQYLRGLDVTDSSEEFLVVRLVQCATVSPKSRTVVEYTSV